MRLGFVGLGQMGAPMAANLAGANDVKVFDLSEDAMNAAVDVIHLDSYRGPVGIFIAGQG